MTAASVVIPAHDEEAVIGRCLDGLTVGVPPGTFDVVVVCNGCTDATARIARGRGVRVLELPSRGKAAALNAGDAAVTGFPRFYVDADVEVRGADLLVVAGVLARGEALAAAPRPRVDLTGVSRPVRDFYQVWTRLPYVRDGHVGSGVVGVSEQGRARFDRFPDAIADDSFLYHRFAPSERRAVDGTSFTIHPARTVADHVRRRVRVHAGNTQLRALGLAPAPGGTGRAGWTAPPGWLAAVVAEPALLPALPAFGALTLAARRLARRKVASGDLDRWERDPSSRRPPAEPAADGAVSRRPAQVAVRLADPRTYAHLLRVANFYAYAHTTQRRRMTLGEGVRMGPNVSIRNGERVSIGRHAHIGERSYLWAGDATGRVDIGEYALFGPEVLITASDYGIEPGTPVMHQPKRERDVRIGRDVWLGARVIVTAGVEVGDGAIVGAGAVVTRSIPPDAIAVGAPARVVGSRRTPRQREADPAERGADAARAGGGGKEAPWPSTSRS